MDTLDVVVKRIVAGLGEDPNPLRLSERQRALVLAYAAQGVIDNGGFQYFFENDWPGQPAYDEFVSAYHEIGLPEEADAFRAAIAWFPFPNPQLDENKRNAWLEKNRIPQELDTLCGRSRVWAKLQEYLDAHRTELEAGVPAA